MTWPRCTLLRPGYRLRRVCECGRRINGQGAKCSVCSLRRKRDICSECGRPMYRTRIGSRTGRCAECRHEPYKDKWLRTIRQRLTDQMDVRANGCWNWTGATFGPAKYPHVRYPSCVGYDPLESNKSRRTTPYRLMYMLDVGPIPAAMTIDHVCFNPLCCNPAHLQLLTLGENSARKSPRWYATQQARYQKGAGI